MKNNPNFWQPGQKDLHDSRTKEKEPQERENTSESAKAKWTRCKKIKLKTY
nr:MAG TPA: hypothetical protein [Caudoviricetes sp.]